MGWLSERYRVRFDPSLFERAGFLAGCDDRRRRELNGALGDRSVRAVLAARGGYGLTRIIQSTDSRSLLDAPKWLVGFSDFTALHLEATRVGVATLHAHNVSGLGRGDALTRQRWLNALEHPEDPRIFDGLQVAHGGPKVHGPLVGGNLTVLCACLASGRTRLPKGTILLLEDVTEAPYRIDRMLTAALLSRALDPVAACVLGDFTECGAGRHGVSALAVLAERLGTLRIPVLAGLPIGHGPRNAPVHLGYDATVDPAQASLTVTPPEGAVAK